MQGKNLELIVKGWPLHHADTRRSFLVEEVGVDRRPNCSFLYFNLRLYVVVCS
jgi:hypothetical protein